MLLSALRARSEPETSRAGENSEVPFQVLISQSQGGTLLATGRAGFKHLLSVSPLLVKQ